MHGGVQVTNTNQIGEVLPNGAAQTAGLKENDKILEINGNAIHSWGDLTATITENPGKKLNVEVERNGQKQTLSVTPGARRTKGR